MGSPLSGFFRSRGPVGLVAAATLAASLGAIAYAAVADETSTGDKLRILYSNRFTFSGEGTPLVTIEVMSGQRQVRLSARGGVAVHPDGEGGPEVRGPSSWVVSVDGARPATIHEWTVVERLGPDDEPAARAAVRRWTERGLRVQRFETGTVFGVEGEVIDGRELLIAVDPVPAPGGGRRAAEIARSYGVTTSVHPELARRPQGTIVARSGDLVIRNPSVLWFAPNDRAGTVTIDDVVVGGGGSQLQTSLETRSYAGAIYVALGSDGALTVVNAVATDRLLAGLVPAEIFPEAPTEALDAQAIAARTDLLEKIGTRHLTDPYLLCSSQHCQVYAGAGREHPRTTAAVERTRGMILVREGGGLVDARYSASCGGHGEHKDHIWGGAADPSLRGAFDAPAGQTARRFAVIDEGNLDEFLALPPESAYCGATRFSQNRFRWTRELPAAEIDRLVGAAYPKVGSVRALEPLERGVSGRINRLRIRGTGGTVVVTGDLTIRRLLGGLRSSLFRVSIVGDPTKPRAFALRGAGFGHGVGMCQVGAIGMAEQGHAHPAILRHYYAGSHLKRLY